MSKPSQPWKILPHGSLMRHANNLFTVNGRLYAPFGESTRRMSVVRLAGRRLAIFAPIPVSAAMLEKLEALGRPAYLIAPTKSYLADANHWKDLYPEAEIVLPPALQPRAAGAASSSFDLLDSQANLITVTGTAGKELALVVRSDTGTTLIVHDLVSNLPRARGMRGALMRAWGAGPGPCVPTLTKLMLISDRSRVSKQLTSWAQLPRLQRLVMTQGEPIEQPRRVLTQLARELDGDSRALQNTVPHILETARESWVGRESRIP